MTLHRYPLYPSLPIALLELGQGNRELLGAVGMAAGMNTEEESQNTLYFYKKLILVN